MQAYASAGESGQQEKKEDNVSEEEAMLAFSSAKLNNVKIMELPDKDPKKEKKLDEGQEIALF